MKVGDLLVRERPRVHAHRLTVRRFNRPDHHGKCRIAGRAAYEYSVILRHEPRLNQVEDIGGR